MRGTTMFSSSGSFGAGAGAVCSVGERSVVGVFNASSWRGLLQAARARCHFCFDPSVRMQRGEGCEGIPVCGVLSRITVSAQGLQKAYVDGFVGTTSMHTTLVDMSMPLAKANARARQRDARTSVIVARDSDWRDLQTRDCRREVGMCPVLVLSD